MEADTSVADAVEDEINSYRRGFGDPIRLLALVRQSVLLVPLDDAGMPFTGRVREVDWLPVFTRLDQYTAYLAARDREAGDYQALTGFAVVDELLPRFGDRVGLVINPAGDAPFAFPWIALRDDLP
ncbi:SseB family protein [Millisia brevis]|uniref:SseB family protein n=1 Tax=Millisia brevis TaxID=264148 RepID=UPI00083259EA|nr:SseB family protein [Millisia brevis]